MIFAWVVNIHQFHDHFDFHFLQQDCNPNPLDPHLGTHWELKNVNFKEEVTSGLILHNYHFKRRLGSAFRVDRK